MNWISPMSFALFLGSLIFAMSATPSILAKPRASSESSRITKVSDEWRGTYAFDKEKWAMMQKNLETVMSTHQVLKDQSISSALRLELESHQAKALQVIVNEGREIVPYLLREYANDLRETLEDRSKDYREVKKAIEDRLQSRMEATEAAVKSIGLAAIPSVSDLHARAMKHQATKLSLRLKQLLDEIVKVSEIEQEKARYQQLVGEKEPRVDRDLNFQSDVWSPPSNESSPPSSPSEKDFSKGI